MIISKRITNSLAFFSKLCSAKGEDNRNRSAEYQHSELFLETVAFGYCVHLRRVDDVRWVHGVLFKRQSNATCLFLLPARTIDSRCS